LNKKEIVNSIIGTDLKDLGSHGCAFAPVNIALCKYWGKRNDELNLPVTSSLSVSLGDIGTTTEIAFNSAGDNIRLNDNIVSQNTEFYRRLTDYLDLFRTREDVYFSVETKNDVPTAAGLASSASGFAALISALDQLYAWELGGKDLSVLARLGSGSACRSVYSGFVEWIAGTEDNGMDSHAVAIPYQWPELRVGILTICAMAKKTLSREAMDRTVRTSALYKSWPDKAKQDMRILKTAIKEKNLELLGNTAESNALSMHATMLGCEPPILYWEGATVETIHKVWALRRDGIYIYFTIDAGPNIKLLFLESEIAVAIEAFPGLRVVKPFD